MRKRFHLIISVILVVATINVANLGRAISPSDYDSTIEKIWQKIDTITFTFNSTSLTYEVYMGVRFDSLDNTHDNLRMDVFIQTIDQNYISCLQVNLTSVATFVVNGQTMQSAGMVSGETGCFGFQYSNPLYSLIVCTMPVLLSAFPVTLSLTFSYTLASNLFLSSKVTTASQFFLGNALWLALFIGLPAIIVVAVIIIVVVVKHRRGSSYGEPHYRPSKMPKIKTAKEPKKKAVSTAVQTPGASVTQPQPQPEGSFETTSVPTRATPSVFREPPTPDTPLPQKMGSVAPTMRPKKKTEFLLTREKPVFTTCPLCNGHVSAGECERCGGKQCPNCGEMNFALAKTCTTCGQAL